MIEEPKPCSVCLAPPRRVGLLLGDDECLNCYATKRSGNVVFHYSLIRITEEKQRTADILRDR
jgi:hypothetical protein